LKCSMFLLSPTYSYAMCSPPAPAGPRVAGDKIKTKSVLAVQRCNHSEDVLAWEVYVVSVAAIVLKVWTAAVHPTEIGRERYEKSLAVFHDCDDKISRAFCVGPFHAPCPAYPNLLSPRSAGYCLFLKLFVHSYF